MSSLSFAELLTVESLPDGTLVRFNHPHLTRASARELAAELFDLARRGNGPHLYVDLKGVDALTSQVLLRLIVLNRKLQDLGDRLILLNPQPHVRDMIQATRVSDFLTVGSRG